ncbi:MAG: diacylglycerol kinase family protein [Candidatus Liptonbacteria bacterium]|nr:diacylglycerol kinase family protein [Candidatus Liptonbacteria bacterium]
MLEKSSQSLGQSFQSALRGLRYVLRERNFVLQICAAVIAVGLSFALDLPRVDKIIILILCAFVLSAEVMNSACERILNLVTREHNPEVARVKETLAGAVLIYSLAAFIIGFWIFSHALNF